MMYGLRAQWLHGVWLRGVCVRERASGVAHSLLDGGAESLVLLFPVDEQPRHELRGDGAQSSEAHDLDAGKRLHACGNRARPADENKQKYFAASFQRQKIPRVLHPFRLAVRHLRKACVKNVQIVEGVIRPWVCPSSSIVNGLFEGRG